MGRHKSHNRESNEGTPEVSNHFKDKHDPLERDNRAGGRSRREKRSHKRKRDDASKRRHKERHRGSHSSSKSSSKGKSREAVHRSKDGEGSQSDSSGSFLNGQRGSSHCYGADVLQKHARSPSTVPHKEDHKEHRSKRAKSSKENFVLDGAQEDRDVLNHPSRTEEKVVRKCKDSGLGKEGQFMGVVPSAKLTRSQREEAFMKGQEQEVGLEGGEGNVLEVELRQKALANFMRHQDVSWRTDPHGSMSDDDTRQLATYNEQDEQVVSEVGNRHLLDVGNATNLDTPNNAPCSDTVARTGGNCPAEETDNNLEEGEIKSDDETEREIASSVVDNVLHENIERNSNTTRDDCEKQDDSRITSGREIERAGVNTAAPCVNAKQELSQEQAVKESQGVDLASAQRDSSSNFQEKTMSVMRGGEMVQVSYKVYIPKRAAELARRRLQR
ncbi:hypothetical protein GOP47_0021879 [Adiantum capillus-veneris]|uniref:Uncharacterized protein n=1 Tax=Adiantum capillus-veneris TaxID=13818 RepID=A0A9D4U8N2_ADICA|nr:hypothetical protein GOP47_0021879 [Adiantum capillus-veneris]